MTSPIVYPVDDKDLDDAALWAVIDSASAASLSSASKSHKHLGFKYNNNNNHRQSPLPISYPSPPVPKLPQNSNTRNHYSGEKKTRSIMEGEVLDDPGSHHRPQKMARSCVSEVSETSPLAMVNHVLRTPTAPSYSSPESIRFSGKENSPIISDFSPLNCGENQENETTRHSLSGRFPSVTLFKDFQNAAMADWHLRMKGKLVAMNFSNLAHVWSSEIKESHYSEILEKSDYTHISGSPYIKKSGWRKISFYFNLSYEIKDKSIEFDENRNVIRAEFVVRAYMQGGRFSDGWGSCDRREKRFLKPNHDIPSTAETRAKNKACQDLLGIGEYRPGVGHAT